MIYTLRKKTDFLRYLSTTIQEVQGPVNTNQWSFNDENGVFSVNSSGNSPFIFNVPVRNLKIGDKVKMSVDVRIISGTRPVLTTSLGRGANGATLYGAEGTHRVIAVPKNTISDFQTINLEYVYEGYQFDKLVSPSYDSNGIVYVRFGLFSGFGSGVFEFKEMKIETQQNISGLYPGTTIYYGRISFDPVSGLTLGAMGNSNNFEDLSITVENVLGINEIRIIKNTAFLNTPTALLTPYFQNEGNANKYELNVVTSTTDTLRIRIYDIVNKSYVNNFSTITTPIFSGFMWIGE